MDFFKLKQRHGANTHPHYSAVYSKYTAVYSKYTAVYSGVYGCILRY